MFIRWVHWWWLIFSSLGELQGIIFLCSLIGLHYCVLCLVFWVNKEVNTMFDSSVWHFRHFLTMFSLIVSSGLFIIMIKPVLVNRQINLYVHRFIFIHIFLFYISVMSLYKVRKMHNYWSKNRLIQPDSVMNFKSYWCKYFLLIFWDFFKFLWVKIKICFSTWF